MSKVSLYLDDLAPGMRFTAGPITLTEEFDHRFRKRVRPAALPYEP